MTSLFTPALGMPWKLLEYADGKRSGAAWAWGSATFEELDRLVEQQDDLRRQYASDRYRLGFVDGAVGAVREMGDPTNFRLA